MPGISALFSVISLLAGVSAAADPFFIVQHGTATFTTRVDPIVSPGEVSSHVHTVVGSSSFKNEYSFENSRNGKCTTANIVEDKSNYWIPQLYRKQDNGTFELVRMNRVNTYYLMRRQPDEEVHEFPPGFKMLAGNAKRSTYDDEDYTNKAISYTCLGVSGKADTHAFPEYNCPDDLRANLFFPNCWDGVNTWLEGSKHVAYPASGGHDSGGPCPATHPKRIMSLFYEIHFTDRYDYKPGARVWATGDDVGYSLHGDFTTGWPTGLFLKRRGTCTPDDPSVIIDEDVGEDGPLAALPGNNPIWSANGAPTVSNTTAPSTIGSATVGSSPASSATSSAASIFPSTAISPSPSSSSPPASSVIGAINLVATGTPAGSTGNCKARKRRLSSHF
ncbi:uncharacterized protein I303_106894 [Kwoniella dejecticola CBS 10117]|uniref:DUF1996 domain-containing protein n=1 Tax=Kwoniella dejecticola CBS 10117 TaxID=1296121 RepID=A0AAJ8KT60_9TREE